VRQEGHRLGPAKGGERGVDEVLEGEPEEDAAKRPHRPARKAKRSDGALGAGNNTPPKKKMEIDKFQNIG